MSLYCRYTLPVSGKLHIMGAPSIQVNDLYFAFGVQSGVLEKIYIEFPVNTVIEEGKEKQKSGSSWVHEPRAREIEEVMLLIASGLSISANKKINIEFGSRVIEWIENGQLSSLKVSMCGGLGNESDSREIGSPMFLRSILVGVIEKQHDPAFTFFIRGADDALSHRFIEAYYNFYFFIEYLYGSGKFKTKKIINEFLVSEELGEALDSVIKDEVLATVASKDFIKMLKGASHEEIYSHIVSTRGGLQHPKKVGPKIWHPEKQYDYLNEATFLHLVCLNIAMKRYYSVAFSERVESAYKNVMHCLHRKSKIHIVTK